MVSTTSQVPDNLASAGDNRPTPPPRQGAKETTKKNSAIRKEQNRNSSRLYRERRKQRLALLEQLLENEKSEPPVAPSASRQDDSQPSSAEGRESPSDDNNTSHSPPRENGAENRTPTVYEDLSFDSPWPIPHNNSAFDIAMVRAAHASSGPLMNSTGGAHGLAFHHPDTQPWRMPLLTGPEPGMTPNFIPFEDMTLPLMTPSQPDCSFNNLGQLFQILDEKIRSTDSMSSTTWTDVVRSYAPMSPSSSSSSSSPSSSSSSPPSKSRNESITAFMNHLMSLRRPNVQHTIYVQQNYLFAAVMDNTAAIGCWDGPQAMFDEDNISPFNTDWIASKGSMQLSAIKSKFAATPKDLQPVDEQITIQHHVYLDVIPFPLFRKKALKALAQDPPLLDEDELCRDISNNDGLVVWGSLGNNQGMEACRPWDLRSWEPKPWFLRKYWFLVGGWDEEMWKASRWWHSVRNEKIWLGPPNGSGPHG